MDLHQFDFDLPEECIALRPARPRDSARLLAVHGDGRLEHGRIADLPDWLAPGDLVIANDTRVIRAALSGARPPRTPDGARVAVRVNLFEPLEADRWRALVRPAKRLAPGDRIEFDRQLMSEIISREGGEVVLRFNRGGKALQDEIDRIGQTPLPPYIVRRRSPDGRDRLDYQTVYARRSGSVAAPTAGLHLTEGLKSRLATRGIETRFLTLHVGLGTFEPIRAERVEDHAMHAEWAHLPRDTAHAIAVAREKGHRIVAIGTTSLRTLETAARAGRQPGFSGPTSLFLKPGDRIASADALLTNFHQPKSTPFVLACALMGTRIMHAAYREAIAAGYRFLSYGDACLLLPDG